MNEKQALGLAMFLSGLFATILVLALAPDIHMWAWKNHFFLISIPIILGGLAWSGFLTWRGWGRFYPGSFCERFMNWMPVKDYKKENDSGGLPEEKPGRQDTPRPAG